MRANFEFMGEKFLMTDDTGKLQVSPSLIKVGLPRDYIDNLRPLPGNQYCFIRFSSNDVTDADIKRIKNFEIKLNSFLSRGAVLTDKDFEIYVR